MIEFLAATENLPFTVALAVMLGLALIEGIISILGLGMSEAIDTFIPEINVDGHVEAPAWTAQGGLGKFLAWLHVGKVPVLMILVCFLTAFGLLGLGMQSAAVHITGTLMPGWLASIPALILSVPLVRVLGKILAIVLPKDETEAVSDESLVGRVAVLTLGRASAGNAAQAKVYDIHNHSHYVMVEPENENEFFEQGEGVLLVRKEGVIFYAVRSSHEALIDEITNI